MRFFTYIFCRRQIIIHAKRDYHSAKPIIILPKADHHSAKPTALLPIIYIIRNYSPLFPAVLEVGAYKYHSILRKQLTCA